MSGFTKIITGFFKYKEPKNEELGFELLEDENEGNERDPSPSMGPGAKKGGQKAGASKETNGSKQQQDRQTAFQKQGKHPAGGSAGRNESRKTAGASGESQANRNTDDISTSLDVNLATIKEKFLMPKNKDMVIREFKIGRQVKAFIAFVEGMMDKETLNLAIFPHLMAKDAMEGIAGENLVDYLMENILTVHGAYKTNKYGDAVRQVLNGLSVLFVEGCGECIIIETRGYEKRGVEQPVTETVVKGPQEGFTENLRTNITLIRKIVKNENLVTEILPVGKTNNSTCAVIYLAGIANPKVIEEVKKRIKRIDTDYILGDGMIEQFIEDNSLMLFPQTITTERPDRSASFLMEGQVVIIGDGSPFALTVPVTFFRLFHTSEDSYVRWPSSIFLRLIRLFGLFCATFLPGIYVALTLYHIEMIPTELLVAIARAKEVVPFPTILEVLMMEISFELIREGGIRVPSVIGQTLGIVGALILGQAAVAAGLVSPLLVIVVSITGLGSFAIPNYTLALAIRIERFLFILAGAVLGFYGVALMAVLLAYFACSMKSFGVPYLAPVAPRTKVNPDVVLRFPIWMQSNRPDGLNTAKRKREGDNVKLWISEPDPGENSEEDKS